MRPLVLHKFPGPGYKSLQLIAFSKRHPQLPPSVAGSGLHVPLVSAVPFLMVALLRFIISLKLGTTEMTLPPLPEELWASTSNLLTLSYLSPYKYICICTILQSKCPSASLRPSEPLCSLFAILCAPKGSSLNHPLFPGLLTFPSPLGL